jgi:hypothetical protein
MRITELFLLLLRKVILLHRLQFIKVLIMVNPGLKHDVVIHPDIKGNVPSMHMNERGITLKYGEHAGRLIRPARSYAGGNQREFWPEHYTNAIYSDDGGIHGTQVILFLLMVPVRPHWRSYPMDGYITIHAGICRPMA